LKIKGSSCACKITLPTLLYCPTLDPPEEGETP
jgi:hypothetical protein